MKDYVSVGNEKEKIALAEKLGFTELVFIGNADISKLKSKIKLSCSKRIIKSDVSKDRNVIESRKADIIYEFESANRKDGVHFLNSGLNQVLAKLMNDKMVSYGISFSQLIGKSKTEQARILGRIMQNLKLVKKYKVSVIVGSFASKPSEMRDSRDLVAFAKTLGLNDYRV